MRASSSASPPPPAAGRMARALGHVCLLLALLLPLAVLGWLIHPWPDALQSALRGMAGTAALPVGEASPLRLLAMAALATMPVLMMSMALLRARACLRAFGRGDCFTREPVLALRAFAGWVLAAAVAGVLVPTLAVLLLTLGGPGQASLVFSFGSQQLILMLFSALTWQIAAVMARAVVLAEENAQFV